MSQANWQVHKFGGSSLGDAACFQRVARILLNEPPGHIAVVVSAMGGMTDALLSLAAAAERSGEVPASQLSDISSRYLTTAKSLLPDSALKDLAADHARDLGDVEDILQSVALVGSAPARSQDLIAGFGELWSSRLLAAVLSEQVAAEGSALAVHWLDARRVLFVEHTDLGPSVLWQRSRAQTEAEFAGRAPGITVITGFIASDAEGLHTTLGRNGSDFSASIMAALLRAERISIWTDVDGVMSADPNRVPEAAVIDELSYSEAMELAYFGAKVIHPQTMSPAVEGAIPIWIRNSFNQKARGSRIGPDGDSGELIKGVTSIENVTLVNLEGTGMIGVPGTADRLFGALREAGISVILISQASSEHSICFAVPARHAPVVRDIVQQAFEAELDQGQIQSVEVQSGCSIIAVVGDNMAGIPGIAAKFFGTLGSAGINVRAIAQGSSERNISAVIDLEDATRALRSVHSGFYLSAKTLSLGLVGPGHVGSALIAQLAAEVGQLRATFGLDLRVRAIATSSRMLLDDKAIDLKDWQSALDTHGEPLDWARFSAHVNAEHLPHAAVIDCSASDTVADRYLDWFADGLHIVTPNKKAHSASLNQYDALHHLRRKHNVHFLYETTVGAGLPVIETVRDLRQTGDDIYSIEGIFSGTLAYLFNVFDGSRPFSEIVRAARDSGYTEPDPRDDLSGLDVARKVIILGREMGMRIALEDLQIESLVPEGLQDGSIEDFLTALPAHDEAMRARCEQAQAAGKVLRYVGRLSAQGASVQLEALPDDHPFARINLTDNVVRYESRRYSENPLVVQGPGAGPEVTAAGVFADVLRLASYLGASR